MPAKDDGRSAKSKDWCSLFAAKEFFFRDCRSSFFPGREAQVPDGLACGSAVCVRAG